MNPSEYMDIVNEIERKFHVADWEVQDVKIWPLVRINLATNLQMERKHPSTPSKLKMLYRLLLIAYEQKKTERLFRDRNNQDEQGKVAFLSHSVFRTQVNDSWYDRFCDPIREKLEEENIPSYQFEYVPRRQFRGNKRFPSQYIQSKIDFIKFKHEFKKHPIEDALKKDYQRLTEWLKERSLAYCLPSLERMTKDIFIINELSEVFYNHLKELDTKIGLVVYYYGIEGFAFNLACRKLGIQSVDIQHGVQGEYHRAYGRWVNAPRDGYELLPSIFWCWNEEDEAVINEWADSTTSHLGINGGYPWLELWKNPAHPITKSYTDKVDKLIHDEDRIILVTLQKERKVPDMLLEAMRNSPSNWKWWIRLHPAMMQQYEEIVGIFSEFEGRVDIENATKLPLYALLAKANIHLTEWSSTVIEADALGVPSIIIHPFGNELFHRYVQSGKSAFVERSENVIDAINQHLNSAKYGETNIEKENKGIAWLKDHLERSRIKSKEEGVDIL